MKDFETYTGILKYKEIEFTFVFDKKKLKLIPSNDNKKEVEYWFMKEIGPGTYTLGEPFYIKEVLLGISNETGRKIVFIPSGREVGRINSTLIVDIEYYIINKFDRERIDRIAIKGPEITHIFPTTQALNKINWEENGKLGISTKPFIETTTEKEYFKINDKELSIYFGISISSSYKTGEAPLTLNSTMFIEFEPTDDYEFVVNIIEIAKKFIQYLCYRRNISFCSIEIASPASKGLHETFANMYKVEESSIIENYPIDKGRFIKYDYVKGNIGKIINDIVSKNIYLEHIPDTYESGRRINAGKYVMITAGFEWEFNRNYPEGIKKSDIRKKAEENVCKLIDDLINKNSGKSRQILKFLKKLIKSDSLESKINTYGKDYNEISDIFGNRLYDINNEKLNYKDMGKRLSDQRNHFAHGDIDKEFIGLSLLDLVYLEYIIYIMQLKFYGVDDNNIKKAINDLFGCNIAL